MVDERSDSMKVVYYSFSGNVRRFISRAGIKDTFEITQDNCNESVNEPYILVTGTIGFGGAAAGSIFLNVNHTQLQAVAASGNRNWDKISLKLAIQFLRNIKFH